MVEILEAIRQKRAQLDALRAQADAIEAELREISALAEGKNGKSAKLPFGRSKGKRRSAGMMPGSTTERAFQVLDSADRPLLVEEIIERIAALTGGAPIEKPTLVSNLSRYVQRGDTFTRVAPNTYGLKKHAFRDALANRGEGPSD